jgi:peptidoglycan/xylan/chitin deacetylase (PgdA/CDA1 family)
MFRLITCMAAAAWVATLAPGLSTAQAAQADESRRCRAFVYLTLDTGNMSQAQPIAAILARQQVRATFFLANEATFRGDFALDDSWAGFWQARAAEGHAFGSHTFDHVYFRSVGTDAKKPQAHGEGVVRAGAVALARPQFGPEAGRARPWDAQALCQELDRVDARFRLLAGVGLQRLWRAPGGRAPPAVMQAAQACGWTHVYWADAGFLGDELPSDRYPNQVLLARALAGVRDGDVLMAHLGIWSRQVPFAPMLEPLIETLKARGFCFRTLAEQPFDEQGLARGHGPRAAAVAG